MAQESPMDRLVCGDVGYGKTEVAMRAAMRAVLDSKQVAVLAPTTVLAFQHWKTFRARFAPFPSGRDGLALPLAQGDQGSARRRRRRARWTS
jgi:transcription-repair coupling factor (superfamily II helicase)